jgi:predicted GNAT family N-acyltransferase
MLFETYLKRMASQDLADRAALIAHEHLVPWYETFGFVSQGPSQAQHGGGGWIDMVLEWKQ